MKNLSGHTDSAVALRVAARISSHGCARTKGKSWKQGSDLNNNHAITIIQLRGPVLLEYVAKTGEYTAKLLRLKDKFKLPVKLKPENSNS